MDQLLDQCFDLLIKDYIDPWYNGLYPNEDVVLPSKIKRVLWHIVDALHER